MLNILSSQIREASSIVCLNWAIALTDEERNNDKLIIEIVILL